MSQVDCCAKTLRAEAPAGHPRSAGFRLAFLSAAGIAMAIVTYSLGTIVEYLGDCPTI